MNPERKEILNLVSLPGRFTVSEAAWRLGFEPDHLPILVAERLLKPLGDPPPGSGKYYLATEIEQKKNDVKWMHKASEVIRRRIKYKNERAARKRVIKSSTIWAKNNQPH